MILLPAILEALNTHKRRVLQSAELSLPADKFMLFRKIFLGEFGRDGLERELARLIAEYDAKRNGQGRK
jgi:hypothetical protein